MRNLHKSLSLLLLALLLVTAFCVPAAAREEAVPLKTVTQTVVNDPVEGLLFTHEDVVTPVNAPTPDVYHLTVAEAAAQLREGMKNRQMSITVGLKWDAYDSELMLAILNEAFRHTGVPTEGDYLLRHYGGCSMTSEGSYRKGPEFFYTFTYSINRYYTDAQQEAEVDAAVAALLAELNVWEAEDYDKVKAVYDYICTHVTYDYAGLADPSDYTTYSAWKALIKGTAVCQGYANLFYRLILELGVDSRIISGLGVTPTSQGLHGWNIVKLKGKYYNLDATWDSSRAQVGLDYVYLLCSPANFTDHIRDAEYDTPEFHTQYPMGEKNYDPLDGTVLIGDMNGDYSVNDMDAMYLLRYTLFGDSRYPIPMSGDVNSDGSANDMDAMYLLRYTLFGSSRYPLYP